MRVLVLVLGPEQIAREGLQLVLQACPECSQVEGANCLKAAERLAAEFHPEVILVGFGFPLSAVHAARRLRSIAPKSRLIVLSSHLSEHEMAELLAIELRQAGASGLLPASITSLQLREALRACISGQEFLQLPTETPISPNGALVSLPLNGHATPQGEEPLTSRQAQVLRLIAEGLLNKEIADQLGISIKTVEKHRQSVKERLHAANTADLTRRAIRMGLAS